MLPSGFQVKVDQVSKAEWSSLLSRFEDANIYQSWSYGAVRWGERSLSHLLLLQNGEVHAMAQLRVVTAPVFRCGIAYLRWGPLWVVAGRQVDYSVLEVFVQALRDEYVHKRGLVLRILPNAFEGTPRSEALLSVLTTGRTARTIHRAHERTFLMDLSLPLEVLRKRLDQKWRNQLNRAEREDLTIEEGKDQEGYEAFLDIYKNMWEKKRFETSVDAQEFALIFQDLPEALKVKVLICKHHGMPVSAIVCSAMGNTGIYLLGATNEHGRKTKAAYLLQWTIIRWLKENGFTHYDLGGIDLERNPGVFHFKNGLSGQEMVYMAPLDVCQNPLSSGVIKLLDAMRDTTSGIFAVFSRVEPACAGRPDGRVDLEPGK